MNGVGYGMNYADMDDYQDAAVDADGDPAPHDPWEKFYNTLGENSVRSSGEMKVVATSENGSWRVKIFTNGDLSYEASGLSLGAVEKLEFQTHWGSGVKFSNMEIK